MNAIKPEETGLNIRENIRQTITAALEQQAPPNHWSSQTATYGKVLQVGDNIARVSGLRRAMSGEEVCFADGTSGIALNLGTDYVGVVLMGECRGICEGDRVTLTGRLLEVPVGDQFLGRVVNALRHPIDRDRYQSDHQSTTSSYIEPIAPGIISRESVCEPLSTGITSVDAIIPIGRGQRELIIGDRQTGKTALRLDTIINQRKIFDAYTSAAAPDATADPTRSSEARENSPQSRRNTPVRCIYVAIGQKASSVAQVVDTLTERGAINQTVVVAATADRPAALKFLSPYTGATLSEYWIALGQHTLIVYDDLSKHAQSYREISLLLRRPPGREAYPGDIFYIHSRLLERAAKLNSQTPHSTIGGGSMTALPIVETQAGDVSAYIPTNVISITDGQIYLSADLFNSGLRPAVDVGISVSRVGSAAQPRAIKLVAGKLKLELAQCAELEAFAQFASDLDASTQQQLKRGRRIREILKQRQNSPVALRDQVTIIWLITKGLLDSVPLDELTETIARIMKATSYKLREIDFYDSSFRLAILEEALDSRFLDEVITKPTSSKTNSSSILL